MQFIDGNPEKPIPSVRSQTLCPIISTGTEKMARGPIDPLGKGKRNFKRLFCQEEKVSKNLLKGQFPPAVV